MNERFVQVIVRPAEMHAAIKERAGRNDRTMSAEIRRALRAALAATEDTDG